MVSVLGVTSCTSASDREAALPDDGRGGTAATSAPAAADSPGAGLDGDGAPGTLRWAITEPSGITPPAAVSRSDLTIVDLLFDSLTALAADGAVVPSLAASWRSTDNARRWTFSLAPAVFHDGSAVTAQDVVRGWEATVRAGRPQLHLVDGFAALRDGQASRLRGLRVIGPQTLEVHLSGSDVAFPLTAAHPSLGPLPASSGAAGYADQPVGNGPFEMAEPWARGRFIRLRRVQPTRSGPLAPTPRTPDVREVVFRTADPATSFVRLQQDRVDVAPVPGGALPDAIEIFGAAPDGSRQPGVHTDPRPGLVYLGLDTRRPPFDDVDVRRALSLAIDRDALTSEIAEGNVDSADALVPPAVPGHVADTCTTCTRDVEEARRIFTDRGVERLELTYEGGPGDQILVDRLRADLAEVGVELATRPLAFADLLEELASGSAQLYTFGWMTEVPSAYHAVAPLVSGAPQPGVNVNYGGYRNPEVDDLLAAARSSHQQGRRARLVRAAEELALGRDQAVVPLYTTNARIAVADGVQGLSLSAYGSLTLENVQLR